MKHVVNSAMVCHLWANQSQDNARNSRNNLFFEKETLYSYRHSYPIAKITDKWTREEGKTGQRIVLFQRNGYSHTTASHISEARYSLSGAYKAIDVDIPTPNNKQDHSINLEYLASEGIKCIEKAKRARLKVDFWKDRAREYVNDFNIYKVAFYPSFSKNIELPEDFTKIIATLTRRQKIEQKKAEKFRIEREREAFNEAMKKVPDWISGKTNYLPYNYDLPVFIRKCISNDGKEIVQTSKGAEVPYNHAKLLFRKVQDVMRSGIMYQRNGHTVHVGSFAVDSIDIDGTLKAGCHIIKYTEIERFATNEGWMTAN